MKLEDRLKESELHANGSSLLWAQWCFDKALVTRSLNVINTTFPHYSLHDASHSISIISEIERILGQNIEKLSYVDTWLILEAAYWHDIGMIIPHDEKENIISTPDFKAFLEQLEQTGSDYSSYASTYRTYLNGGESCSILELDKAFTFLLAEYIRRSHPDRSKHFLLNPDIVGIKSPDTGLINSRLFELLGDIIVSHGKDFSAVLELPYENDGIETGDIAHPRFVSSLLRLGDLLDLDDGRHCPTQLLALGKLPSLSQAHLEKHRSIISKSVSAQSIEVKSRCKTFDSFEVQNDWFGYIEREIEDQDKHWGDIAPKNYIGKLPTIKGLICLLENSIPMGRRDSRLSIDVNRIYDFLTGKSIYENPLASISEVLQNSVDATIDRIWVEFHDKINDIKSFREIASKFSIDVTVESKCIPNGKVEYLVSISDSGKGMKLDDIKSIITIASEQSQKQKRSSRQGMPSWMQPSGFFGIGLQSVFSVTDQIQIETQSANDQPYEVEIRSTKGKTPSFVVKRKNTGKWKFGTTLKLSIIEDAIPERISGSLAITESLSKFDPLKDLILTAKESQIKEQVYEFSKYCEFAVTFNNTPTDCYKNNLNICDIHNGIEYAIEFTRRAHISEWKYRGRSFKTNSLFKYFNINGNIISERADSFLPLSREKIHSSGQKLLNSKIIDSVMLMKNEIMQSISNKEMASFFYFINGNTPIDENWKEIKLYNIKITDLIQTDKTLIISFDLRDNETIKELESLGPVIGNYLNSAELLKDAALKLNYGVDIINISKHDIAVSAIPEQKRQVIAYTIQFKSNKEYSRIDEKAIRFLSDEKLNDMRVRYFLPCGKSQFNNIKIPSQNQYQWITPLTSLYDFFEYGIILHSTSTTTPNDMEILTGELRKIYSDIPESEIKTALKEFYKIYPFDSYHEKTNFW